MIPSSSDGLAHLSTLALDILPSYKDASTKTSAHGSRRPPDTGESQRSNCAELGESRTVEQPGALRGGPEAGWLCRHEAYE